MTSFSDGIGNFMPDRGDDTEVLFTAALQLEAGWKVRECRFEGEPHQLLLKLDFEQGKRFGCPQCGKLCAIHDTSIKRWRHLNFFQYERLLEARVPRSNCPEHGVLSVAVPWAREGSGFTLLFEALAMLLCREMPMAAVADTLGSTTPGSGAWRPTMSKRPTQRTRGRRC
jgi:hypothetical protein